MEAASPNVVLFDSSIASEGVLNVVLTNTGPKISSCMSGSAVCKSVIRVGGKKHPSWGNGEPA